MLTLLGSCIQHEGVHFPLATFSQLTENDHKMLCDRLLNVNPINLSKYCFIMKFCVIEVLYAYKPRTLEV